MTSNDDPRIPLAVVGVVIFVAVVWWPRPDTVPMPAAQSPPAAEHSVDGRVHVWCGPWCLWLSSRSLCPDYRRQVLTECPERMDIVDAYCGVQ